MTAASDPSGPGPTGWPVAVTGIGIQCAIAAGAPAFAAALRAGRAGFGQAGGAGATIPDFRFEAALSGIRGLSGALHARAHQAARRAPVPVQLGLVAALEAWGDAQLHIEPSGNDRAGVIVTGSNLTQRYIEGLRDKFASEPEYLPVRFALHALDTDHLGTVSEVLGITGEGHSVGGASASGNVALLTAGRLIASGDVDVCLVLAPPVCLSAIEARGYAKLGAMAELQDGEDAATACRPFDAAHRGFLPGEAAAAVVLERPDHARARGVATLAELRGAAVQLDGNRLADPNPDGEARAMTLALRRAGRHPGDVDYVNAHGTGTPRGDVAELEALRRVFAGNLGRPWINATKGLTGHCLHAAGVVEAIATVLQLREGFVHPNANLVNPIVDDLRFAGAHATSVELGLAISNSFGFAGINTSVVLAAGPPGDRHGTRDAPA